MAKIDTSKIEGYAAMTAEQKLAALEGYEYDDGAAEVQRLKDSVSKANSEAAEWKRKHNAQLTEEERKKQERETQLAEMQAKIAEFEHREKVAGARADFLGLGLDDASASDAAEAFVSGDAKKMFGAMQKYRSALETKIKSELMDGTPKPEGGDTAPKTDYSKQIAEAQASGDIAAAVYYTGLQETAAQT